MWSYASYVLELAFILLALAGAVTVRNYSRDVREVGIQWADEDQLYAGLTLAGFGFFGLLYGLVVGW